VLRSVAAGWRQRREGAGSRDVGEARGRYVSRAVFLMPMIAPISMKVRRWKNDSRTASRSPVLSRSIARIEQGQYSLTNPLRSVGNRSRLLACGRTLVHECGDVFSNRTHMIDMHLRVADIKPARQNRISCDETGVAGEAQKHGLSDIRG